MSRPCRDDEAAIPPLPDRRRQDAHGSASLYPPTIFSTGWYRVWPPLRRGGRAIGTAPREAASHPRTRVASPANRSPADALPRRRDREPSRVWRPRLSREWPGEPPQKASWHRRCFPNAITRAPSGKRRRPFPRRCRGKSYGSGRGSPRSSPMPEDQPPSPGWHPRPRVSRE